MPAKKILVAIDLSDCSRRALDAAIAMAKDHQSGLVVVHAFEPSPLEQGAGAHLQPANIESLLREGKEHEALELAFDWVDRARHELDDVSVVAQEGPAPDVIGRAIEAHDPWLIVVGTHGRTGFRKWVMGSVAQKVVQSAHRPVLVVPVPAGEEG